MAQTLSNGFSVKSRGNSSFQERKWNLESREQNRTSTLESRYDQIKCNQKKTPKICKWSCYNQMGWAEMRSSEKDWNLPKLFPLNSQNQARMVNRKTGKEIEEMKCYQMMRENSEKNKETRKVNEMTQNAQKWPKPCPIDLPWNHKISFPFLPTKLLLVFFLTGQGGKYNERLIRM